MGINLTFDKLQTPSGYAPTANRDVADKQYVDSVSGAAPLGTIVATARSTAPSGWLLCDGSAVSRATYADLFTAIGTTFGEGDGTTTFNLPDLRGRFLRGVDLGAGRDPDVSTRSAMGSGGNAGDAIGSIQDDAFATHTHGLPTHGGAGAMPGSTPLAWDPGSGSGEGTYGGMHASGSSLETRPTNAYVNFIIKF